MVTSTPWSDREADLFEQAWYSPSYSREDLCNIFERTWNALEQKAIRMKLPRRSLIEQKARVDAIEKALKEDHVI